MQEAETISCSSSKYFNWILGNAFWHSSLVKNSQVDFILLYSSSWVGSSFFFVSSSKTSIIVEPLSSILLLVSSVLLPTSCLLLRSLLLLVSLEELLFLDSSTWFSLVVTSLSIGNSS